MAGVTSSACNSVLETVVLRSALGAFESWSFSVPFYSLPLLDSNNQRRDGGRHAMNPCTRTSHNRCGYRLSLAHYAVKLTPSLNRSQGLLTFRQSPRFSFFCVVFNSW